MLSTQYETNSTNWCSLWNDMLQLTWRWLMHQKDSALTQWYRQSTADGRDITRKTIIVALVRKT